MGLAGQTNCKRYNIIPSSKVGAPLRMLVRTDLLVRVVIAYVRLSTNLIRLFLVQELIILFNIIIIMVRISMTVL